MATNSRTIKEIHVEDVQKRRNPTKHYMYVIQVVWSDGSRHVVYRRYSRFFDFQLSLLEKFPIEGGAVDPRKRIIPFLPGKKFFGRSQIREVALKRLGQIDEYCKALIKLPPHISEDEEVLDFFDLEPDDLNPNENEQKTKQKTADHISGPTLAEQYVVIADYQKVDKWDLNLKAGMVLEVVEKSDSGWWFVNVDDKQGWVPSTYLERKDGLKENTAIRTNLGEDERYISTDTYTPQNSDEITLEKGAVVEVLEKNLDGWWFVRSNGQEGIAPSTYLMKTEKAHIERVARASGVQIIGRLSEVSDIMRRDNQIQEPQRDNRKSVQHILKKQKSLERGGSLRPPPRLNSIQKASDEVMRSFSRTDDHYVTISEFVDTVGDGITFHSGEVVEVLEKSDSGWWFVKINGKEGWAPATYIEKKRAVNEDIEEEENVYQDIDEDEFDDINNFDDDYEVPGADKNDSDTIQEDQKPNITNDIQNAVQLRLTPTNHLKDNGVVKRPNSKPPPPPVLKPVTIDTSEDSGSSKSLNSPKSPGPPVPPPKKVKNKINLTPNDDSSTTGDQNEIVKAKLSPDKRPQPPPKNNKPSTPDTNVQHKQGPPSPVRTPLAELKSKFSKPSEEKKETTSSVGQPKYKYTDVVPREQRLSTSSQESLVGVLKSKFGHMNSVEKDHNIQHGDKGQIKSPVKSLKSETGSKSPVTSPKSETGSKGFVLPTLKPVTPPKNMSSSISKRPGGHVPAKSVVNVEDKNSVNKSMGELKARFEKQKPDPSKKPPLKPKNFTNRTRNSPEKTSSINSSSSFNDKPSGKASALKAMFEHSKSDNEINKPRVVVHKTNSNSSTSSKTAGIAAMLSSKFESDNPMLKPQMNRSDNTSSKPPFLPSKPNVENTKPQQPQPLLPPKPLNQKSSNSPSLPPKTLKSATTENVKSRILNPLKPSIVDKNHNEMETCDSGHKNELAKIISNKKQSDVSPIKVPEVSPVKSEPPTPPVKDYEMLSDFSSQCYKTAVDYIAEGDEQVGFTAGETVEVLEQTEDWWYIKVHGKEGWAPAAYIGLNDTDTNDDVFHKQYTAVCDFVTEAKGELGLQLGDILEVLEETDSGWWLVRKGNLEGWAPSSYLEQA